MDDCPGCLPTAASGGEIGHGDEPDPFRAVYGLPPNRAAREIERRVLGSDFGANGYTTREEADELGRLLELGPGARLLDVGAGEGWPGLYLARETGCTVVLSDRPEEGLRSGRKRAARRAIGGLAGAVAACATRPPLRPGTFDAVVHADVLCCLSPKLDSLKATRRMLRRGSRTVFTSIFPTPGLTRAAARRARQAGPPACGVRTGYPKLMESAGLVDIEERDVTPDYLATARRKLEEHERFETEMIELLGEAEYAEVLARRRRAIAAIEAGLLRRAIFVGRRRGGA